MRIVEPNAAWAAAGFQFASSAASRAGSARPSIRTVRSAGTMSSTGGSVPSARRRSRSACRAATSARSAHSTSSACGPYRSAITAAAGLGDEWSNTDTGRDQCFAHPQRRGRPRPACRRAGTGKRAATSMRSPLAAITGPSGARPTDRSPRLRVGARPPPARVRGTSVPPAGTRGRRTPRGRSAAAPRPPLEQPRARQAEHGQSPPRQQDPGDDRVGLLLVVHDAVVERAVRLHVRHARARPRGRRPRSAPIW